MIVSKKIMLLLSVFFLCSACGRLQFDNSVSFAMSTVSTSSTPAQEDVRSLVVYHDLVYTAAGSGGILVYRIVGDAMTPVLSLSLTNLYSENLEQVYVRTIEILETPTVTNLIYAYDTLSGGGIGIANISPFETQPIGSLQIEPGVRIKNTTTTFNPQGIYHVLAAQERVGIVAYDLSFRSNSYFEIPQIASLVDYVAQLDLDRPAQQFLSLNAPGVQRITNISQITNIETLVQLALDDPAYFASVISNIPFIPEQQRSQIQQLLTLSNTALISQAISSAREIVGDEAINNVLANPQSINTLLNSSELASSLPNVLASSGMTNLNNIDDIQSNITPELVAQAQNLIQQSNTKSQSIDGVQNILSASSLQQIIQNALLVRGLDDDVSNTNNMEETDTLFEESLLSNLNLSGDINTKRVHNTNFNPFDHRDPIGNANAEIQRTVSAVGRPFFIEENEDLKNRILALGDSELQSLFQALFSQADTAISLIPLFENSGINIQELYQFWKQGDFTSIIENVDSSIIAELLRQLPRYNIETTLSIQSTNIGISSIQSFQSDLEYFYVAAGTEGAMIVDRLTWKIHSSIKKPFSEITSIIPYQWNGKKYYVITDKLDGLIVYKQTRNKKFGEQVARISLVGESLEVVAYEDILWVADGSNGVLAIRMNKDESLTIEAELYQKNGIAYHIGSARRREVLASYGADGLKRLRITNVIANSTNNTASLTQQAETTEDQGDFIDRIIVWSQNSSIAQFLKRILL